jgi:hypothetical protein
MPCSDGVSLEFAKSYGEFLQRYSCAQLTRVGWSIVDFIEGGISSSGQYASIGLYAKIFLAEDVTGKRRVIYIPAPKEAVFDEKQDVKLIIGQEAATEFSILTGRNYTFRHGTLWGSTVP